MGQAFDPGAEAGGEADPAAEPPFSVSPLPSGSQAWGPESSFSAFTSRSISWHLTHHLWTGSLKAPRLAGWGGSPDMPNRFFQRCISLEPASHMALRR